MKKDKQLQKQSTCYNVAVASLKAWKRNNCTVSNVIIQLCCSNKKLWMTNNLQNTRQAYTSSLLGAEWISINDEISHVCCLNGVYRSCIRWSDINVIQHSSFRSLVKLPTRANYTQHTNIHLTRSNFVHLHFLGVNVLSCWRDFRRQ